MESFMVKVKKEINDNKRVFLVVFCIGIIIHLFVFTNKLCNWDEICFLFSKGGDIKFGRWFITMTEYIFPNYSMPVFNGVMSLILIVIETYFIIKIIGLQKECNRILVGLILISFPVVTCTFMYMYTAPSYMLAMLMSVLSAYIGRKEGKTYVGLAIILLTLSLGIYQAYISISATLFLIVLMEDIFSNKDTKEIVKRALKFAGILIMSLLLYALINQVVVYVTNEKLSNYQGIATMNEISIKGIFIGIMNAYKHLLLPIKQITAVAPTNFSRIIYFVCIFLDFVLIGIKCWERKIGRLKSIMMLFVILLLPISMNMIYILNGNVNYHGLMMFGDCFIFVGLVLLLENMPRKNKCLNATVNILVMIQIFIYFILANKCYLQMQFAYENTYAFYEGITTTITQTEGFDENTKIIFTGTYYAEDLIDYMMKFQLPEMTGVMTSIGLINCYSKVEFIKDYIGFQGNFVSKKEEQDVMDKLQSNQEFINMPHYPYYGSIKKIDDLIVVKLGD